MNILLKLIDAGLTFETRGNDLVVTPARLITKELRALIVQNKPVIWSAVREAEVQTAALISSINQCCDARSDTDENRAGLIADTKSLTIREVRDLLQHFNLEAARWLRATGQAP